MRVTGNVLRALVFAGSLAPWAVIAVGGTVAFSHFAQIQDELHDQQAELAQHQASLDRQLKINESIRVQRSLQVGEILLALCVESYRIDDKLARLGKDLYYAPSLDMQAKDALADFTSEVSANRSSLHCKNPFHPPKKKLGRGDSHVGSGTSKHS